MDDLEFRRTLLADPNLQSDEINDAIAADPSKQEYVNELLDFDAKLTAAAQVDVPNGLASKLLNQVEGLDEPVSTVSELPIQAKAANDNKYWQMAAAACFAFVLGITLNLNGLVPNSGLGAGEYALKYTYKDLPNGGQITGQMPLEQVNAKLVSYGVQMEEEIGDVLFADSYFCNFNEMNVLRMVVGGETGNINLYIFPKENKLGDWNEFSDDRFNGKATRYSNADMVIVGEKGEPLKAFQSKMENSLKWI